MMIMVTSSDIATKVRNRVASIPSSITNAMVTEYVEDSIIEIQNMNSVTILNTSIDTKYQAILTDMGAIKVLRYMLQPGFSLGGELSINRSETMALIREMEKKVAKDLNTIVTISSSGGVATTEPKINLP
jgi:hypothetical protein